MTHSRSKYQKTVRTEGRWLSFARQCTGRPTPLPPVRPPPHRLPLHPSGIPRAHHQAEATGSRLKIQPNVHILFRATKDVLLKRKEQQHKTTACCENTRGGEWAVRAHVCVCCGWVVVVACVCLLGRWGGQEQRSSQEQQGQQTARRTRTHTRACPPVMFSQSQSTLTL